ncbi:MAG: hypothetical protein ACW981_19705 [Candidatus Hodarchaeales archaeon]|jgi:chaperonin cofactor prefoldin
MIPANSPRKTKSLESKSSNRTIISIIDKLSGVSEYIETQSELASRVIKTLEHLPSEVDLPMSVVSSLESIFKDLKKAQNTNITARDNITNVSKLIMNSSNEIGDNIESSEPSPLDPVDSETINSLILVNHHKLKELGKIVEPLVNADDRLQNKHDLLHERFNTIQSILKDMQLKVKNIEANEGLENILNDYFDKQKEEIINILTNAEISRQKGTEIRNGPNEYDNDIAQIDQIIRFLQNFPTDKQIIMDKLKELRDNLNTGGYVGLHHRATSSTLFREVLAEYKSIEGIISQKTNQEVIDKFNQLKIKIIGS